MCLFSSLSFLSGCPSWSLRQCDEWTFPWAAAPHALLQRGSIPQVCPSGLHCSSTGPTGSLLPVTSTASLRAPPWLHVEMCPWAAGGQPAPSWGSSGHQGTSPNLEHLLHWPFGCRAVSLTVFSHTAPAVFFYTSLNTCHRDAVSFMDWLSFGQGKLELALPTRTILSLFSGGHPHSPFSPLPKPCYINLVLWDSVWCILWELWIFSDVINTTQSHTIKY